MPEMISMCVTMKHCSHTETASALDKYIIRSSVNIVFVRREAKSRALEQETLCGKRPVRWCLVAFQIENDFKHGIFANLRHGQHPCASR